MSATDPYDFTDEPVGPLDEPPAPPGDGGGGGGRGAGGSFAYSPTFGDLEKHREGTRRWLAYILLALLSLVALVSLVAVVAGWQTLENVRSIVEVIFPPIVALAGSALGFFYGERSSPS